MIVVPLGGGGAKANRRSGVVELFFFVSAQLKLRKTNGGAAVGWGRISHVDLLSISTSIAGRDVL